MNKLKLPIRMVTASALFDGHDAAINMIRRLLQDAGVEVIHLGHNRSVHQVVKAALEEGVHGICVSSYQGGHMEYYKYLYDELKARGAGHIRIYGGGGGVILPKEKAELEAYGITKIFHPEDGRSLGLEGMIQYILKTAEQDLVAVAKSVKSAEKRLQWALDIHCIEEGLSPICSVGEAKSSKTRPLTLGITGTGGAGKSSLIDEIVSRVQYRKPDLRVAVVCVDPSKRKSGGGLLGDRIRMNSVYTDNIYMRSLASRGSGQEISASLLKVIQYLQTQDFDLILAETSGIGQGNSAITDLVDQSIYVMTSEFGAPGQLEKIDMIDLAQFIVVNKSDRRGAEDALREVSRQYRRSRKLAHSTEVPVFLTQASQFNDPGVNKLFEALWAVLRERGFRGQANALPESHENVIIPPERQSYLAEIAGVLKNYKKRTQALSAEASRLGSLQSLQGEFDQLQSAYKIAKENLQKNLTAAEWTFLANWDSCISAYKSDVLKYEIRGLVIEQKLTRESLSHLPIPRIAVPDLKDWGDRLRYIREENLPGAFPFTAGVFPLKRPDEEPKRMFAGEGPPERTNKRFHYLCQGEKSHRLSTAFDSVTLYGEDPSTRPDIFGKVGESGVSVCTLNDMKSLFAGFDLCSPQTSVSMTINGPAPMILAFYFNSAIDQQVEKEEKKLGRALDVVEREAVIARTLQEVRGTVQADILKEDQGQNTCIFSTAFALKMMGDIQEYFVSHKIRNFYSVSISGYHIAEAGANPISQLAFTLSNGFTFVEYYLSRGMKIDDFSPNLSFFFSNGLDPEYTVLGRVARKIWAVVMRDLYGASERSQKLKYHIQTSGRSLHAQEIAFNDIRTTLQALLAIADHTNSLHTNAYDEAITTPTEESVRRAVAIQLVINREFGLTMNENPLQGSYFVSQLTDMVENAVVEEFLRIHSRGGVLGAMETQYQRSQIQEQSLYYEELKHNGKMPIIGVNTFLPEVDPEAESQAKTLIDDIKITRASYEEKNLQLERCENFKKKHQSQSEVALAHLKTCALSGGNIFASLMEAARVCTLKQMSEALFVIGGQYRRNL